ncbi:IclR family transcriptional regulator [Lentzea californiensis]|uniref:IclR family transcriptional regulator n=1 Tax=Lentzea californiensis TaxID=438851 RepID=UPI0021655540|nr:IclR family transcriptional regulator C-terminal domain-containing protein [Lentzea californiensis]MCR3754299.1 transcriptional regulator, IclR family [Lentzea californiensis]
MDDRTVTGRVVAVLDVVAASEGTVSLAELTRVTGIPKATVRRIAEDLCARRMLRRGAGGGYLLGPHMINLGMRATTQLGLRDAAIPYVQELFARTGEIAWVGACSGMTFTMMDTAYGANRAAAVSRYGWPMDTSHSALVATAAGRLVLAEEPALTDRVRARPLSALTQHTVTSWPKLTAMFDAIRDSGMATEHEQSRLGFSCAAVGLRDRAGNLVGVLGVTGHTATLAVQRLTRPLRTAAEDITRTLTTS